VIIMPIAIPVERHLIERTLASAAPHLARAASRSGWSMEQVVAKLREGSALLWIVLDGRHCVGAALTELHGQVAYLALVGGIRWREWRGEIAKIEEWARLAGCTRIEFEGRAGWSRLMIADGYKLNGTAMKKELSCG
jgi:hypothetical protein